MERIDVFSLICLEIHCQKYKGAAVGQIGQNVRLSRGMRRSLLFCPSHSIRLKLSLSTMYFMSHKKMRHPPPPLKKFEHSERNAVKRDDFSPCGLYHTIVKVQVTVRSAAEFVYVFVCFSRWTDKNQVVRHSGGKGVKLLDFLRADVSFVVLDHSGKEQVPRVRLKDPDKDAGNTASPGDSK